MTTGQMVRYKIGQLENSQYTKKVVDIDISKALQ